MKVKVSKRETVAAVLPLQEHWLPFSNLDLLLPPVDASIFFCYARAATPPIGTDNKGNGPTMAPTMFRSLVRALKASLAQVLVSYYAFAGEVVINTADEPELLCNNAGVDFVEAAANIQLKHLNIYNPDDSVEGKLVPSKKRGVLAVQATEFKCGGMVVGCSFDHRIADAYSGNMFLVAWAEMCRSSAISVFPSFRRSLLHPRRHPDSSQDRLDLAQYNDMYVPISKLPPPPKRLPANDGDQDHMISRIYYVPADELMELQQLASSHDRKRTKLEAFSAFLWKMVAKSYPSSAASTSRLGIVVDGRRRLRGGDMANYFGNVLSVPLGEKSLSELVDKPLSWVADGVHEFIQAAATEEHFLGLIDWVEALRPELSVARIYCMGDEDGPALVVSSGQKFPMADIDFGWGQPVLGSYHFPWESETGYVMPMPSPLGNGDWIVYAHLLKRQLVFVESEAAHVFRPLTYHYLTSHNKI